MDKWWVNRLIETTEDGIAKQGWAIEPGQEVLGSEMGKMFSNQVLEEFDRPGRECRVRGWLLKHGEDRFLAIQSFDDGDDDVIHGYLYEYLGQSTHGYPRTGRKAGEFSPELQFYPTPWYELEPPYVPYNV
jgi:hypothetical protein